MSKYVSLSYVSSPTYSTDYNLIAQIEGKKDKMFQKSVYYQDQIHTKISEFNHLSHHVLTQI